MTDTPRPYAPDEEHYLYTENIDYLKTPDSSIWGTEDQETLDCLKATPVAGDWLNVCAGDGRFNQYLLEKADFVTACDIDKSALLKLRKITPDKNRPKLKTVTCNITERLPFADQSFNGIFCTGTLHLFPKELFIEILSEFDRILKKPGYMIIDFATDIQRVRPDGSLYTVRHEPLYAMDEALDFLKECFRNYKTNIVTAKVEPEEVRTQGFVYTFTSNFILIKAEKI